MNFVDSLDPKRVDEVSDVVDDLLVRAILQAVLFVATGTVLVCSLYKVGRPSSFSWHFLRPMRIAMSLFLGFLFVDVAASTTHYAGFYGYRGTITVWIREAMNAGNYIYAISSLVEGAAHAALFATLFQLSKGVLDTSLAPESSDGCFMRPAGTMVRNVAITVLALLTAAIFGVEIAYVVEMSRLWDIAKDAIYGDLDSLFSLINMDSQSDPGLARDLNLIARQLQAALQCAFLAVALGVVVGAGLVWKRSRAESPVHKSRKHSIWVLGASLLWLTRNVWMVVRRMYITDITSKTPAANLVSHYAIIDVILNSVPTFFAFTICFALSIKGRSKSADAVREEDTLMDQPTTYAPMQQHPAYEPMKQTNSRSQESQHMPGYAM